MRGCSARPGRRTLCFGEGAGKLGCAAVSWYKHEAPWEGVPFLLGSVYISLGDVTVILEDVKVILGDVKGILGCKRYPGECKRHPGECKSHVGGYRGRTRMSGAGGFGMGCVPSKLGYAAVSWYKHEAPWAGVPFLLGSVYISLGDVTVILEDVKVILGDVKGIRGGCKSYPGGCKRHPGGCKRHLGGFKKRYKSKDVGGRRIRHGMCANQPGAYKDGGGRRPRHGIIASERENIRIESVTCNTSNAQEQANQNGACVGRQGDCSQIKLKNDNVS